MGKLAFVTVGTTKFDSLITQITSSDALDTLRKKGFSDMVLQIGNSELNPLSSIPEGIQGPTVSCFHLKNSITEDIARADLVISHAGMGSIMDVLGQDKPLLVVVNEDLMGNHQTEVAHRLAQDGHLHYCTVGSLVESLATLDWSGLKPFPPGQPHRLKDFLDEMFGFV